MYLIMTGNVHVVTMYVLLNKYCSNELFLQNTSDVGLIHVICYVLIVQYFEKVKEKVKNS